MGVGALAGVGVVHPLREEPPVQRHLPAMMLSHLREALDEPWRQRPICWHGGRWERAHELNDFLRRGGWAFELALQMPQKLLTLVDTADRIETRGRKAVRRAVDVVRDDDTRPRRLSVVDCAELAQVLHSLAELPFSAMECAGIEVGQTDTACAIGILERGKLALQIDALLALPPSKAVRGLLHHGYRVIEGEARQACTDIVPHLTQKQLRLRPVGMLALNGVGKLPQLLSAHRRGIGSENVAGHVSIDDLVYTILVQWKVFRAPQCFVYGLQSALRLAVDHVLKHRCNDCQLVQVKAPGTQMLLKELVELARHPVAEGPDE
mmetsp:Transcript_89415/g.248349  ORF Transcript_89415/g.248349 Transcript_89415/m.248349 type:complete len:322 (-) Transcript_89415:514-1479(-)